MRECRRLVVGLFLWLCVAGASLAAEVPVAVSPGSLTGVTIGDTCPTFSWGSASGAESYELVVYLLGEEGEEAELVLSETLGGAALSWTPSLDRCLERGGQYAWSVRADLGREVSGWSPPNLFDVVSGPSEAEFEKALETVQEYLAGRSEEETIGEKTESPLSASRLTAPSAIVPKSAGIAAETKLSVDGNVDAVSFTGDGSGLTDLAPPWPELCQLYVAAGVSPPSTTGCKRVFVTGDVYQGNLGGLAGGDMKCQDLADTAGLAGTFKAWLSDSTTDAKDRLTAPAGPWFTVGTGLLVASDITDLDCSGGGQCLANAINRTETGEEKGSLVWTGTGADGTTSGPSCGDWRNSTNILNGLQGFSAATFSDWTFNDTSGCATPNRVYCFQEP